MPTPRSQAKMASLKPVAQPGVKAPGAAARPVRKLALNGGQLAKGPEMRSPARKEADHPPVAAKGRQAPHFAPRPKSSGKGGLDIGKFAREVSTNYGRGVAEVGRQLGSIRITNPLDRAGRKDPLAGRSVQNAVDFGSRTNASNNPLKRILAPKK